MVTIFDSIFRTFKKKMIFLIVIPMFISLATQVDIGTDYNNYIRIFKFGDIRVEKGYLLFNDFLKMISKNERILFIGVSFLQMLLFYIILLKYYKIENIKKIQLYVLILCISTSFYVMLFNGLRSSIASLFFNIFILLWLEKRYMLAIILLGIGGSFHVSIYLATGIILITSRVLRKTYNKEIILIILILCFFMNKFQLLNKIAEFIYNLNLNIPYKEYLISNHMISYTKGLGIATILNFLFYLLCGVLYKKIIKDKKNIYLYNLGFIMICLRVLFAGIPILNRMLEYFNMVQALVFYSTLKLILKKKYCYIGVIIILFYLLQIIVGVERMLNYSIN